jgi:hypothetical protein
VVHLHQWIGRELRHVFGYSFRHIPSCPCTDVRLR